MIFSMFNTNKQLQSSLPGQSSVLSQTSDIKIYETLISEINEIMIKLFGKKITLYFTINGQDDLFKEGALFGTNGYF